MIENWTEIDNPLLADAGRMELKSSENITMCRFFIEKKMDISEHAHVSEQITLVNKGRLVVRFDNREIFLEEGDSCIIPSSIPHSAEVLDVPFESYDIFSPVRKDFIEKIKN